MKENPSLLCLFAIILSSAIVPRIPIWLCVRSRLDNSLNSLVRFCFATQSVSASRLDKPRSTSVLDKYSTHRSWNNKVAKKDGTETNGWGGRAEKEREILCIHVYEFQREIVSFRILLFGHPFLNLICNFDAIVDNKSRGGNEIFFLL